jgi:Protein of unknown function (DUF2630)
MREGDADRPVQKHIEHLVKEEHRLYDQKKLSEEEHQRLQDIKVELDQCWDLLRQRRALREFGEDPGQAKVRPAKIVENYEQ